MQTQGRFASTPNRATDLRSTIPCLRRVQRGPISAPAGEGFDLFNPPAVGSSEFADLIEALAQAPRRDGNRLTILRNGGEIFPAMLEAIGYARKYINVTPRSTGGLNRTHHFPGTVGRGSNAGPP